METIFDHNPTLEEIEKCGFFDPWQDVRHGIVFTKPITKETYVKEIIEEAAIMDIALLFEERSNSEMSRVYWGKIPDKAEQYRLGFDNNQLSI